jgi:hypothetical protein
LEVANHRHEAGGQVKIQTKDNKTDCKWMLKASAELAEMIVSDSEVKNVRNLI